MNEKVWHKIMSNYVRAYEAIEFLLHEGVVDEEGRNLMRENLLKNIIVTFESEVTE